MGAVLNQRPDLFASAIAEVPFVDVLNTMFNTAVPWTAYEFQEWGDPNDPDIYRVMKSYCPYTNIEAKKYPHIMITAGMNDPRVSYCEPAKFAAKLREHKRTYINECRQKRLEEEDIMTPEEEDTLVIFKVEASGHSGTAGRYARLEVSYYQIIS